jgi:protein-disulfide isomerase
MNQMNAASRKLLARLRESAKVTVNLEPPRMKIDIGESPVQGPKEAKVTIIDFSDYQCPFCGQARKTLKKIMDTYGNSIRLVFKDFPMSFHRDAEKAHEAAYCAGDQGKYWSMHELLFTNQNTLKVNNLKYFAKELGLDMAKFNKCLDDRIHAKRVTKNIEEARKFGVKKAPTFFINGIMLEGVSSFNNFKEIIDAELIEEKK